MNAEKFNQATPIQWWRISYFFGWWARALFTGAILPFVVLGVAYWTFFLLGEGGGEHVHALLVMLATAAPPDAWERLPPVFSVLIWLPSAVYIGIRIISTQTAQDVTLRVARWIEYPFRAALRRVQPRLDSKLEDGHVLMAVCGIGAAVSLMAVMALASRPQQTVPAIIGDAPLPARNAAAALSMADGTIISGEAIVERRGDEWVVRFEPVATSGRGE